MRPQSEAELAEAVKTADGPLVIVGGGTRTLGNNFDATRLETSGLSGVTLYEPAALTIVAQAGTPLAEIEATLASERQMLSFEPPDHTGVHGGAGPSTIGGVVAANASGSRRIQAGACRDLLLGVRLVDGRGDVIKNGGRVMKNVTGYDLVKLVCGSHGTLGVLSEVSLKVLPKPETRAVLLIEGLDDATAISTLSRALGSPFDVTGAAHLPVGLDGEPVTMIRLEGFEKSVAYRAEKLRGLLDCGRDINIETDRDRTRAGWAYVCNAGPFLARQGDIWRVSVKPGDAAGLVAKWRETGLDIDVFYDWGGGLIWVLASLGTNLRQVGFSGHATIVRGGRNLPAFHPEPPALAKISQGLRAQFDPGHILNPGRMG